MRRCAARTVRNQPAGPLAGPAGAAVLLALLLAGCVTFTAPPALLAPEAQEALLQALPGFALDGRVGVRAGGKGENGTLAWLQQAQQTSLRLAGPFGAGGISVTWQPGALRLAGGRNEVYEGADAERVLAEQLGFVPPFDALRYWVLGLPAPGEAPTQRTATPSGRIAVLVQREWQIEYDRWQTVSAGGRGVELPGRVTVRRDDLWLRVVVEKWKL